MTISALVGMAAAVLAAMLWIWAELTPVSDETSVRIRERVARAHALGAVAAGLALLCGAIFLFG